MVKWSIVIAALLAAAAPAQSPDDEIMSRMLRGGPMLDEPERGKRIAAAATAPLGSKDNPVRTAMPAGQRSYLARLRCADGAPPAYKRAGNYGPGPYIGMIDGYTVQCGAAPSGDMIYMDMYHPDHVEAAAVPGFTITPP